jgi:hypothetical protein
VGTSYGSVVTFTTASLTPVQLTSFTAASTGAGASLIWKTATETNNYGFSVERRTSGSNTWSDVAFVKGNGTSATAHSYSYTDASVTSGSYIYRLKQVDNDGTSSYSNEAEITVAAPSKIVSANYPNPFNPSTVIRFSVPKDGQTVVKVFNILGQEVATLFNGLATAGFQSINFNAAHMNSGVYFYSVENNGQKVVNKMLLVK